MAKKKTKKITKVWSAQPADAIRLAALRWFALRIESLAIEIYASDKTRYASMETLLRVTLKRMRRVKSNITVHHESECPDGFVLCKDGLCAPMCEGLIADS